MSKLAVDLKISTTTVTGWKRGARPQSAQIKKISEYFKISTDELMDETPPTTPASALPEGIAEVYAYMKKDHAEFLSIMRSQQDTIQNLSKSNRNFSESTKSLAVSQQNFSESTKNFSESTKNISESNKSLAESNKKLTEYLSKGAVAKK